MVRFHWVRSAGLGSPRPPLARGTPLGAHWSHRQSLQLSFAPPAPLSAPPPLPPSLSTRPSLAFCVQHVEGQQSAWVPHKGIVTDEASGVRHITVDMEVRLFTSGSARLTFKAHRQLPAACLHC